RGEVLQYRAEAGRFLGHRCPPLGDDLHILAGQAGRVDAVRPRAAADLSNGGASFQTAFMPQSAQSSRPPAAP
ncbi:MAG TPA: hypothetical protein VF933_13305, partial [Streptosporangiaceae bacterium]